MLRTLQRQFQTVDVKNIILPGYACLLLQIFNYFAIGELDHRLTSSSVIHRFHPSFLVNSPFPHKNQHKNEEWRDFSSMGEWTTAPRPCT
jgi:hypothetical protein